MTFIKINEEALINDLIKHISVFANDLGFRILQDIRQLLDKDYAKNDNELKEAEKYTEDTIRVTILNYAKAIMDSFGTGTEMDLNNEYLAEYIGGELWNPLRQDAEIVGRPKGTYINIFGDIVNTSGRLEGVTINRSSTPSYAIQTVLKRYFETDIINNNLTSEMNEWVENNMYKYFTN